MRLLIIEDNEDLCEFMKIGLSDAGFTIDTANTGIEGEEKAYLNAYDVILLDLTLPDKDGMEILKSLREAKVETPVMIVSARDEIEERAQGLDFGADDYLTKPFQMLELQARVRAVIRRYYGRTNPNIHVGKLCINPLTRVASWEGENIPLSVKEFDILEYIASRYPEIVSSEDIAEHIYNEDYDPFSTVLRVHLSRLRKKLQAASGGDVLITVRGKGYYIRTD